LGEARRPPPVSNEPLAAVNEAADDRSKPQISSGNHPAIWLNGLVLTGRSTPYVVELKPQHTFIQEGLASA
jgi:hypothetical protein